MSLIKISFRKRRWKSATLHSKLIQSLTFNTHLYATKLFSTINNYHADTNAKNTNSSLLFLSSTFLPEPNASAAGVRTASLLNHFASTSNNLFDSVNYGCGVQQASTNDNAITPHEKYPNLKNVSFHHLPLNQSGTIQRFLENYDQMNESHPYRQLQAVIFDRFFSEEVYSFHFYQHKPRVLRILDMQDMHSLRAHRQSIVEGHECGSSFELSKKLMNRVAGDLALSSYTYPTLNEGLSGQRSGSRKKGKKDVKSKLLRELASIHRSDLTLVCSPYELSLLRDVYGIPSHKLALASFFIDMTNDTSNDDAMNRCFHDRDHFVTLGGFKHPPNIDQVKVLKYDIWPKIREQIPHAKLYVYGAYTPQSIIQLNDERRGFYIKGYADSLKEILSSAKVMLAPLRFGAGIKGKIIDSWCFGCPVVTTPIGSEGMTVPNMDGWGGHIAYDTNSFVQSACDIYTNENEWNLCHERSKLLLSQLFNAQENFVELGTKLSLAMKEIHDRREIDYYSAMLWQQQTRSTEYFSKWIEEKERSRAE